MHWACAVDVAGDHSCHRHEAHKDSERNRSGAPSKQSGCPLLIKALVDSVDSAAAGQAVIKPQVMVNYLCSLRDKHSAHVIPPHLFHEDKGRLSTQIKRYLSSRRAECGAEKGATFAALAEYCAKNAYSVVSKEAGFTADTPFVIAHDLDPAASPPIIRVLIGTN